MRGMQTYEVSSKGDRRFSALFAKLRDGRTIEEAYQLDVKGYRRVSNDWRAGKGKPPLEPMSTDALWKAYLGLWVQWARENPKLIEDLRVKARGKVLTDRFATSQVNQARALSEILYMPTKDTKKEAPPKVPTREELIKELADATAALQKAEAAQEEELVSSKAEYSSQRDESGWLGYAEDVYEKFFAGYPQVAARIDLYKEQIRERLWVVSPIGHRRTMYRILTGIRSFIAGAERRAVNSPIQGFSSQAGSTAGYLVVCEMHDYCLKRGIDTKFITLYCRAVHDASYFEEAYRMILPAIHINQHVATVGLHDYYKKVFNFDLLLDPEIEMDIGASDARSDSWNWVLDDLPKLITGTIDERVKDGYLAADKRDAAVRAAFHPWINKEERHYLQQHYPLLQVTDLEEQICTALERAGMHPER